MLAVIVFWLFAVLAVGGAIGVVAAREAINSVLFLVAVMLSLSVLFLLLNAQFVFAVQVIVYAGAVMVLFLFVVALLGPILERPTTRLPLHLMLSAAAAVPFVIGLLVLLGGVRFRQPDSGATGAFGTIQYIGQGLFTIYVFPFELTSILLLVAAVGAIYLSRGDRGIAQVRAEDEKKEPDD